MESYGGQEAMGGWQPVKKCSRRFYSLAYLLIVFAACSSCTTEAPADNSIVDSKNANADTTVWGDSLEWHMVDKCLRGQATIEGLENFLEQGGDVNAFVVHSHRETYTPDGIGIPVFSDIFEDDDPVTLNYSYKVNVFHALLMARAPLEKMELCVYLLQNGADLAARNPDGQNALECLLAMLQDNEGNTQLNFTYGEYNIDDYHDPIYNLDYIDTLISYGADPLTANLHHGGACYLLLMKMLKLGADPKTIDVNSLVERFSDTEPWQLDDLFAYGLDFSKLDGVRIMQECDPEDIIPEMINAGFDVNTKILGDGYLLDDAIRLSRENIVKLLVDAGADKVEGDKNPYLFAQEVNASDEVLNYLADEFK